MVDKTTGDIVAEAPSYYGISRIDDKFGNNLARAHTGEHHRAKSNYVAFSGAETVEIHLPNEPVEATGNSGYGDVDQELIDESEIL